MRTRGGSGRILVLGTGGTISSSVKRGKYGVAPTYSIEEILEFVPQARETADLCTAMPIEEDGKTIYVDSSNMQPEYMQQVARCIYKAFNDEGVDGAVVLHGTDTLEESCADLTFELLRKQIPVVFTGSMRPIDARRTDAVKNIMNAIQMASSGMPGTYVVFNGRVISAPRTKKLHPSYVDAFRSINFPELGRFVGGDLRLTDAGMHAIRSYSEKSRGKGMELRAGYSNDVHLLELYRGIRPSIIDHFFEEGYLGLVLKAFGTGGVPNWQDYMALVPKIERWSRERFIGIVSEAFTGQVTSEYEVTNLAVHAGAVPLHDMLPRTALSKARWALGQTRDIDAVKALMAYPFENEVTTPEELRVSDADIDRILKR